MEVEEQSDQTNNTIETSQEQQTDNMTVPDTANHDLYADTQVTNDTRDAIKDCAANVELNGYEDSQIDSVNTDNHIRQYAVNMDSHISVEADSLRTELKGNDDEIAMETEVTEGNDEDLGEDGEILEDGEIASDQDGELKDDEDDDSKAKSSPAKSKGGHHGEERDRKGKRKERHSKRRRSKEDSHRDKQTKKKRHREYTDYDKTGEEFDQSWSGGEKRDKSEKKGNKSPSAAHHSPSHDNQGEDRGKNDKDHRRGSNDRHHSGGGRDRDKHRGRDRDHNSDKKGKERSPKDKRDKQDKKDRERQSRNSRDSKEKDRKNNSSDNYESPPGIYDSPSDDETNDNRFGGSKGATLMSMVEGEYLDSSVAPTDNGPLFPKNKKKQQRKKEWLERKQQREREMEEEKPPKKKPLLQTPMEERPQCRFFKEGKCQKGSDCPFNHGFRPAKRLEVCKYYVQSTCWNQGECVFMHEEFPCKYFHTGSTCYQGDNCKFSHDPLTEETQIALDNAMADRGDFEDCMDEPRENKKYKKKGLLGDQPPLSEEELHRKLESMKKIPSIFDIETHAPGESPRKPPGQSPMGRPQGFYQDNSMSPGQSGPGPNMNFQGNRPPFMQGSGGPGMDGPPPGMQGPPMGGPGFMGGPGMQGPGMPGPGPGPQGPGMQGAPMGPPMNNQMNPAAALVGAILRAAPMLQQYRGPAPQGPTPNSTAQGPPTSMPNMIDPRFGPQNMGPMPGPNMMGQEQNMGPSASPSQEGNATAVDDDQNNQESELSSQNFAQSKQAQASRDPRKGASHSSNTNSEDVSMDTDMRDLGDVDLRGQGHGMGDVDLRQDVDMRQDEKGNQGNTTPQQEWDDDKISNNVDDEDESLDIPEHLPPKQREMFMRIKQMSMKIKKDQSLATKNASKQTPKDSPSKAEDDKWYSSDEEDDKQSSSNQSDIKKEPRTYSNSSMSSSLNVMQMINAAKSSTQSSTQQRPQDPRRQLSDQTSAKSPPQEPVVIHSRDGDAPWRLIRVVYVKQKVPTNINLNDPKYKADPRVQKMLKMQELEFGKIIDHSKTNVKVETSPTIEPKLPDLLDPKVFKQLPRPELAPFIDPRSKKENSDPRIKQEPGSLSKSVSNKPMDPRVQKQAAMHNLPGKPMDPRLARQDSSSGNLSMSKSSSRPLDPRIGRQTSSGSPTYSANIPPLSSTPPLDPRMMNRQSSSDPRLSKTDITSTDPSMLGKPLDPRLGRVVGSDLGPPSVHRQFSNPGTREERDAASLSEQKTKIDYRNDPRFKRKHISESNLSPTSAGKRFPEQRKTTTEYSSPLGGETSQSEDSGYNSYNRQRVSKQTPQHSLQKLSESVPMPSEEISTHDILDSLQIMSPPVLEKPDKNLKDIFKTIDPTASPFC